MKNDIDKVVSQVEAEINPDIPGRHYEGQPFHRNEDSRGEQMTKFFTHCEPERSRSLKCIEDNYEKKNVCQTFFDDYKKCRGEERKRRLEENAKKSADGCVIC
jgi:hypothetical protein